MQLRARVVFPKEPDPARPQSPLTMLIVGEHLRQDAAVAEAHARERARAASASTCPCCRRRSAAP